MRAEPVDGSPHLRTEAVSLRKDDRLVLKEISTTFHRGSVTGLVGPSGAGKSSLLRCFNRLESSYGRILLDETDIVTLAPPELRRRIGLVAQTPSIFPGGVRANLAYGLDPEPEHATLVEALGFVGLPAAHLERASRELSVGEAQRVCIARALVRGPEILLLDEPTSSLDQDSARTIEGLVRQLVGPVETLIVVTHDLGQAERICDSVKLLVDGELRVEGTAQQVAGAWDEEVG